MGPARAPHMEKNMLTRIRFQSFCLISMLILSLLNPIHAEELGWDFSFISEGIEPEPAMIWFTEEEDGFPAEGLDEAYFEPDGSALSLYLHIEEQGGVSAVLTLTPLADGSTYIPYSFSYDGEGTDGAAEVTQMDITAEIDGWTTHPLIRRQHDYRLTWTPDAEALEASASGVYQTTLTVEVRYA